MLEKTKGTIKKQSRDTGSIGYTRHKTKQKGQSRNNPETRAALGTQDTAENRKYSPSQQKYISSCRFVIYVDCLYVICHKIWTICCTTSRHNWQLNKYIYISFQGPLWPWSHGCWIYYYLCNQRDRSAVFSGSSGFFH